MLSLETSHKPKTRPLCTQQLISFTCFCLSHFLILKFFSGLLVTTDYELPLCDFLSHHGAGVGLRVVCHTRTGLGRYKRVRGAVVDVVWLLLWLLSFY